MSYYKWTEQFKWFMGRVVDINDPEKIGRVKIRVIHEQTGDLAKKVKTFGITDDELLWAWPLSAVQSSSLHYRKINELEFDQESGEGFVPDWIRAVGLSPTGIAVSTYVFGFYLDGHEQNIPVIFGTYHKVSRFPEPPTDEATGKMLQIKPPTDTIRLDPDVSSLARGEDIDLETGNTLPKAPYKTNKLWGKKEGDSPVDEHASIYQTLYPYNTTYTTKSGHAIELDDTEGHERIHVWHKSGSYEEIGNGEAQDTDPKVYPAGPKEYVYKTAGGVAEKSFKGRRIKRTTDSSFEVVVKDKNELLQRDHNVEIANTQSMKVGNTLHWTVGHATPPGNRVNDNLQTDYQAGNIDKANAYIDVANNFTQTAGNNHLISVGKGGPDGETRWTTADKFNQRIEIANNQLVTIGNNHIENISNNDIVSIGNNQIVTIGKDQTITIADNQTVVIGKNCNITISGSCNINISGTCNIESGGAMTLKSGASIKLDAPRIDLN